MKSNCSEKEIMFSLVFVYLFAPDDAKTTAPISMKFGEWLGLDLRKNLVNFGTGPDKQAVAGTFSLKLTLILQDRALGFGGCIIALVSW